MTVKFVITGNGQPGIEIVEEECTDGVYIPEEVKKGVRKLFGSMQFEEKERSVVEFARGLPFLQGQSDNWMLIEFHHTDETEVCAAIDGFGEFTGLVLEKDEQKMELVEEKVAEARGCKLTELCSDVDLVNAVGQAIPWYVRELVKERRLVWVPYVLEEVPDKVALLGASPLQVREKAFVLPAHTLVGEETELVNCKVCGATPHVVYAGKSTTVTCPTEECTCEVMHVHQGSVNEAIALWNEEQESWGALKQLAQTERQKSCAFLWCELET